MMLHRRDQDFITCFKIWATIALGDQLDGLGGAAHKNHFMGASGIDESSDLLPCLLEKIRRALTEGMNTAMDIGLIRAVDLTDAVNHTEGFLGRGRIIKIDQWMAVNAFSEDGELLADRFKIQRGFLRVH